MPVSTMPATSPSPSSPWSVSGVEARTADCVTQRALAFSGRMTERTATAPTVGSPTSAASAAGVVTRAVRMRGTPGRSGMAAMVSSVPRDAVSTPLTTLAHAGKGTTARTDFSARAAVAAPALPRIR